MEGRRPREGNGEIDGCGRRGDSTQRVKSRSVCRLKISPLSENLTIHKKVRKQNICFSWSTICRLRTNRCFVKL